MKPPTPSCEGSCKAATLCGFLTTVTGDQSKCTSLLTGDMSMADLRRTMEETVTTC